MFVSTDFASFVSPVLGAINSRSLPETGTAKLWSSDTRKKSCPAVSPAVCADAVTVAEANANNRQDAVVECQCLWILNRVGSLSRPCARRICKKPLLSPALPRCRMKRFLRGAEALERGCAPSFSAHVRQGEHGAPVQGSGLHGLLMRLKLDARGKLEGARSAGSEESARRADRRIEVGLHRLCRLAILCGLVRADGDITARIVGIA